MCSFESKLTATKKRLYNKMKDEEERKQEKKHQE